MKHRLTAALTITFALTLSACSSSNDSSNSGETNPSSLRLAQSTRVSTNGSVDTVKTIYSESGNIHQQIFAIDGEIYLTTTFESKPNGQFLLRSEDIDQDGIEDQSSAYVYDENGNLRRIDRIGPDGLIDVVALFLFEGELATTRISRDIDDVATSDLVDETSGSITYLRDFEYEDGRLVAIDIDSDEDGEYDRREDYAYNPDGTLATTTLTSVTEGTVNSSVFVYEAGVCHRDAGNSTQDYFCISID